MGVFVFLGMGLFMLGGKETGAENIVLKNGRRIVALRVVVEGDKVRYLTSAGELALPKSIVDHIEKGGQTMASPSAGAANPAITPPSIEPTAANTASERGAAHRGRPYRHIPAAHSKHAPAPPPRTHPTAPTS